MAIIRVYEDCAALAALPPGRPLGPAFRRLAGRHPAFFTAVDETWGPLLGPGGAAGLAERLGPGHFRRVVAGAAAADFPALAAEWLERSLTRLMPCPVPDVYLGTLLDLAPAATLDVAGRPAIALGLERFAALPGPPGPGRPLYRPEQVAEMLPHEACHVARLAALGLPASPLRLSLADMLLLEGTAIAFADRLLGRPTLPSLLPPAALARHEGLGEEAVRALLRHREERGLPAFLRLFGPGAAVNGYWAGRWLCERFLAAHGEDALPALVAMPARRALAAVGFPGEEA